MGDYKLLILLINYAIILTNAKSRSNHDILNHGKSLLAEKENEFLISPNGTFSCGFYKVGTDAYCFSIWYTESLNKTVVWMANRDRPVNGKRSKLTLRKNGNLVLTGALGSVVWSTNTYSQEPVKAKLLDTGNFILINKQENYIWESFKFPTDTLLPMQSLVKNTTLTSNRSPGTYLSGFYKFKFDDNNVLNLIYNGPVFSSVYWPSTAVPVFISGRTPYNSTRVAFFNEKGRFKSSDNLRFNATDFGLGPKRRLTLDYDGILRLYSLDEKTGGWLITWLPGGLDACLVHGLCGPNSVCGYEPLTTCSCLYGFERIDQSDWSKGCSPRFNLSCEPVKNGFYELPYTDYYGYDLNSYGKGVSFESCRTACLINCKCQGFVYSFNGEGECFPKSILLNGFRISTSVRRSYIKVPREMVVQKTLAEKVFLNCSNSEIFLSGDRTGEDHTRNWSTRYLMIFVGVVGVIEIICITLGWWYIFRKHANGELEKMGYVILAVGFKRFTFVELKKATKNFKYQIGKGGFGTVYKGTLEDDTIVAVKRLEGILQGESEFWAEVAIIGKLNHKNLVKMRGFCAEGEHKLLVYEYMKNGSLDNFLFRDSVRKLDLEERYNIAIGTAKALAYIHEECLEWVLHCDVKPQNILLDEDLEPKVTDFGMSNLFRENQEAGFSRIRGTRGYVAPEWMRNTNINAKADVYSYGVVLLELLSGKSASRLNLSEAEYEYECECEYNHLVQWARETVKREGIEGVIDPMIQSECDFEKIHRFFGVALSCVREERDVRPPMSKVVELLSYK